MEKSQPFDRAFLDDAGLNRQAVFNIAELPADIAPSMEAGHPYRQLILVGHAGKKLWERVKKSGIDSENPIDDFTVQTVSRWFSSRQPENNFRIVYPGSQAIGLQRLGQLAGWHSPSPFMVGIDPEWGSWFAYRAVVLADTEFEPTTALTREHPCRSCDHQVCIARCPGAALEGGRFDLGKCVAYRRQAGSGCQATCLARVSCPVGSAHRYCDEQLRHTYSRSLQAIRKYC